MSIEALAGYDKYDSYQDSEESWIGHIPEDWSVLKLKHIFYEKKHTKNMDLNCGSISFGKVIKKNDDKIPYSTKSSYQEVLKGEFLINPLNLNFDLISLRIALSEIDVVVSAGYIVLKNREVINKNYFKYLLHYYDISYMKLLGSGVRQTINFNNIANSLLPMPSHEEQTAIANFLDQKTIQIDQAINLKQQQIAKLNEYKQITIQNAVTKGLDANAKMKDSGIDWLGDIPEHWEVKSLKRLARISPRIDFSEAQLDDLVSFLPMEKVSVDGAIDCEIKKPLREVKQGFTAFQKNDVILAKITPCFENGKGALLDKLDTDIGFGSTEFHVLRAGKNIKNKYLYIVTQSHLFLNIGEKMMTGSAGQKRVPTNFVANFPVALPPIEEQHQIVIFIDDLNKKSLDTVGTLKNKIERLKEYKTILINHAVTGKIKVS